MGANEPPEPGWYWVQRELSSTPEVGCWTGRKWLFMNLDDVFDPDVGTKILSERMEPPNGRAAAVD